jgi:hypothetical protein
MYLVKDELGYYLSSRIKRVVLFTVHLIQNTELTFEL